MLAFKLNSTDYYTADPNAALNNIPKDAVVFGLNYPVSSNQWSFLDIGGSQGRRLIRGGNSVNLGLNSFSDFTGFGSTTTGEHTGNIFSAIQFQGNQGTPISSLFNYSNGSHAHAITGAQLTSTLSNTIPSSLVVSTYKALSFANDVLPANSLVFAEESPGIDYTAYNLDDTTLVGGNTTFVAANIGTKVGSNNYNNISVSVSTSGSHNHATVNNNLYTSSSSGTTYNLQVYTSAGSHTHTTTVNATPTVESTIVKAWVTSKDTKLANGVILGYVGRVNDLPSTWYLCNGQTVKGHVTPNLANKYPKASSSFHKVADGANTGYLMSYTMASTVSHTHMGSFASVFSFSTSGAAHSTFDWTHDHSATNQFAQHNFPSYNMHFIIYLP
jgi:hypothetical protein